MKTQTRVGLVGTGDIGRIHARALAAVEGVRLCIARGCNPERAESLASELNATTHGSFASLLGDPEVEAVDICVPNDLHAEHAIAALRAGKHVLCEKPMAMNLDDARQMIQEARGAGRVLMIGHVLRYWREYAQARDLLAGGEIGRVRSFSARRLVPLLRAVRGEQGWRHSAQRSGGAALDLQIHDLDYVAWLFGPPQRLTSRGVRSESGAFDHVFTLLEYANGLVASVESSFMLQGNPVTMDFRVIGDEGSLEFAFRESNFAMHAIEGESVEHAAGEAPPSLIHYQWGNAPRVLARQPADPIGVMFNAQIATFVQATRGITTEPAPSPESSLLALALALASIESCTTGKSIQFEEWFTGAACKPASASA